MSINWENISDKDIEAAKEAMLKFAADVAKIARPWIIVLGAHPSRCLATKAILDEMPEARKRTIKDIIMKVSLPNELSWLYIALEVKRSTIVVFGDDGKILMITPLIPENAIATLDKASRIAYKCLQLSWPQRISSFFKFLGLSIWRLVKNKKVLVSDSVRKERLRICDGCAFLEEGPKCGACGCPLKPKSRYIEATCPKDKWPR